MFAKVFAQIFDSSISEDYHTRLVFEDMLKLSDAAGVVDMTHEAIARRTNVPLEIVQKAITALEQPDPRSRNPEQEGRRIVRLDEHRDWGWQIVNYEHYRNVRDDTERRRQNREAQSRFRRKHTSASVSTSKQRKPRSAQVEEEAEEEKSRANGSPSAAISDEDWLKQLATESCYGHIRVREEHGKMQVWCRQNKREPTRKRFVNWLNRIERPLNGAVQQSPSKPKREIPERYRSFLLEKYPAKRDQITTWRTWEQLPAALQGDWQEFKKGNV